MPQNPYNLYSAELTDNPRKYRRCAFPESPGLFDAEYSERGDNPPVFTKAHAQLNVLVPEDPTLAALVRDLVAMPKQHRWFRSMKSSQALAVSVFGNLKLSNRTACLSRISAEDGVGRRETGHSGATPPEQG